jgi:long-chain fatty acid transport protein
MKGWKGLCVVLVLMLTASTSFAAGFRLPEAGAKAMGMGFAFTAQADDPSAIYFNPAGIMQLEGMNFMGGGTFIKANGGTFTGTTPLSAGATITETQKDLNFVVPNAYFTRKVSKDFAYGVGIFSPYGLGQEFQNPNTSYFRNVLTKIDLQTVVVNPTVAFQVDKTLSVGLGVDFMYGKAKLKRTSVIHNINIYDPEFTYTDVLADQLNLYKLSMDGDGTAWGYNFGLLFQPGENVKVGFSYRSPFKLKLQDDAVAINEISSTTLAFASPYTGRTPTVLSAAGGAAFATKGVTTLNLPATAALGVSYKKDRLTLEADADWTFWHSWKSLLVDMDGNTALFRDIYSNAQWNDVVAFRIGAQYQVTDPLALRVGFAYDPTPVPGDTITAFLPDATRLNYSVGAGYKFGNWTIDGSYLFVDKQDRTVANQSSNVAALPGYATSGFNGKWSGSAHLVALDVGYKF